MSASTWGGPELHADESYPSSLLRHLLGQLIVQFAAHGACIALLDESIDQMKIQAHVRLHSANMQAQAADRMPKRRLTIHLENGISSLSGRNRNTELQGDELEDVSPLQSDLFAPGSTYTIGQDLIGYTWLKGETSILRHEDYLNAPFRAHCSPIRHMDIVPTCYLAVPIQESTLIDDLRGRKRTSTILGVIVLYQVTSGLGAGFHQKQRSEAAMQAEQITLYLQNDRLQRSQQRTSEYLQRLQEISTVFPSSVTLADLVKNIHHSVAQIVDVSSMLLTLYDRDMKKIYDVFALYNGMQIEGLVEHPDIRNKEDRPVWWQVAQQEKRLLHFSPAQEVRKASDYAELLTGTWGDQRQAESFLLLPMKMFNRVIGTLSLTSMRPNAYHPAEIQVLETMAQIVTVNIENAKLYERDRVLLQEAKQREAQLAAINSALQSIGSGLNVTELLNNLVKSVAVLVNVDMCVFFQVSSTKEELITHTIHAPTIIRQIDDGSARSALASTLNPSVPDELINMVRFPIKGTALEQSLNEGFFYLDGPQLEELAQKGGEAVTIFLQETQIQHMLMIPMSYQAELVGILGVPTPKDTRSFRPKDIGSLLAICAQATSAIRNAQLFEQREEAYAELEHLSKLKDEFLVTASHELRTPLTAISGYSSQLRRRSSRLEPAQILRFATKIAGATEQLINLVSSMTEAAQLGAEDKKLVMEMEPVHVLSAVEIASTMLSLNAEHKIFYDVDPNLWVRADIMRFRQVLTNLFENAVKYSSPESNVYLSTTSMTLDEAVAFLSDDQFDPAMLEEDNPPVVLIRVQDQGEGILPADQQRIFEKFVRAPRSLTTPVRGSGLGLYICRRYTEAMGGKLWLERSVPNEGSIFSFYLPRVDPPIMTGEQETGERKIL
ncbi:MAG: GAF domain-containing protein [Ktedonobacteraceae bacterium]|nr:GAF domain-containing protein [Ktedonobacteraceae bacterium]